MVTAVRHVAAAAVILFDRTVEILFVLDLVGKCRKNLAYAQPLGLIMAGQTKGGRFTGQQRSDG